MSEDKRLTRIENKLSTVIKSVDALRLAFDAEKYNVLAPTVHMPGGLPQGTRLVITEIKINPDASKTGPKEVFAIAGGALMPSKVSLDKISNAAGISWKEEKRQDNGKHPHYCEMFVRGVMTDFDGTTREITGVKAVDLRQDAGGEIPGKDYDEIVTKAARKGNRDPSNQLMEARKFIQEIAASKAKNRAIASGLGIKRSYSKAELDRPFIVPKLSMDPNNECVRNAVMANMLGETAVRAMFGPSPNEVKVVDAHIEEPPDSGMPSTESGGDESAGESSPSPADSDLPPMDEPEQQKLPMEMPEDERKRRLGIAWRKAKDAGMKPNEWGEFMRNNTGKDGYADINADDVGMIDAAVEAYIDSMGN